MLIRWNICVQTLSTIHYLLTHNFTWRLGFLHACTRHINEMVQKMYMWAKNAFNLAVDLFPSVIYLILIHLLILSSLVRIKIIIYRIWQVKHWVRVSVWWVLIAYIDYFQWDWSSFFCVVVLYLNVYYNTLESLTIFASINSLCVISCEYSIELILVLYLRHWRIEALCHCASQSHFHQ